MKFGRKSINYQYLRLKSVLYRISQYRMFACIIVILFLRCKCTAIIRSKNRYLLFQYIPVR